LEQVVLKYWNEKIHIGLKDWRAVFLLDKDALPLIPEVYKGNLVYSQKGSSKRYSYKEIKGGIIKKKIVINVHLPFLMGQAHSNSVVKA
jgi:hypothetical protein